MCINNNERKVECGSSTNSSLSTYESMLVYCIKLSFFFLPKTLKELADINVPVPIFSQNKRVGIKKSTL